MYKIFMQKVKQTSGHITVIDLYALWMMFFLCADVSACVKRKKQTLTNLNALEWFSPLPPGIAISYYLISQLK